MIGAALVVLAEGVPGAGHAASVIAGWHDFYLLAGTAAVTLVGLLFVALSFNLDVLLDDSRSHVLGHARETLLSFVYVLIVSLLYLVPEETPKVIGVGVVAASIVPIVLVVRALVRSRTQHDDSQVSRYVMRRRLILLAALLLMLYFGVRLVIQRSLGEPYAMVGCVSLVLGNAVGASWDLLVQVGRLKRAKLEAESRR